MEIDIKSILERRIEGAKYRIAESEAKIASEELYRNKWQIRKDAFENILEEWNELQKQNADVTLVKEAMNTHVHVNVESMIESIKKADEIIVANPTDFNPQTIIANTKYTMSHIKTDAECIKDNSLKPTPCKVFTVIEPFKEVPAFVYRQTDLLKQIGKTSVFCNNHDGVIAIWRAQYKINIFTTLEEIKRMKSLPEMIVKLTLQDYEKRTYPNKAVVLRHFLRELKDVSELKVELMKPKTIPTFSTMKQVDEVKK